MGNRHVKRGKRKILYEDMKNLFAWSMSECLPTEKFHEFNFLRNSDAAKAPFGSGQLINEGNLVKSVLRTPDKKNVDAL